MLEKIISMLDNGSIRAFINNESIICEIGGLEVSIGLIFDNSCIEDFSTDEIAQMIFDTITNWEESGLTKEESLYYQYFILRN